MGGEGAAFLYFIIFLEGEAKCERLGGEKKKRSAPKTATRAATEHIEQSRVEREQHIEGAQERAEPLRDAPLIEGETGVAIVAEKTDEPEDGGPRRRGRRGGRGSSRSTQSEPPEERLVVPTPP